jgi:hypothetical protein
MAYAIFFCSALIGHPQMNVCDPTSFPSYATLEECKARASKIPVEPDNNTRNVYICMKTTVPTK